MKRKTLMTMFITTIIVLTISFIIVLFLLVKKNTKVEQFNVVFEKAILSSSVKGSITSPTSKVEIMKNGMEININYTLNHPNDELIYLITIENNGTLPAEIIDIIPSPDYTLEKFKKIIEPITISIIDNPTGKILSPNDKLSFKVVAHYNLINNNVTKYDFSYKLGLITKSR